MSCSGGFDVEFGIVNAESSNNYTLFAPTLGETFVSGRINIYHVEVTIINCLTSVTGIP